MIVKRTNTLMLCISCTFGMFGLFRPFVKKFVQLDLMYLTEKGFLGIFGNLKVIYFCNSIVRIW